MTSTRDDTTALKQLAAERWGLRGDMDTGLNPTRMVEARRSVDHQRRLRELEAAARGTP